MPEQTSSVPDPALVTYATDVLRLLADKTRLTILACLAHEELSVGALAEALNRPIPAISQHLAKLRAGKLVSARREGTSILYSQPDKHIDALVTHVLRHAEHDLYEKPPHHQAT